MPQVDPAALDVVLSRALAGDPGRLGAFLRAHSNLPGPRGNLELAAQFAAAVAEVARGARPQAAWRVVQVLAAVGAEEAPSGHPGEFVAFCGTVAAGAFAAQVDQRPAVWRVIGRAAEDERWRLREAAAQAIQRALPADPHGGVAVLEAWASTGSWLLCRAVAAGLADPPLLRDPAVGAAGLRLHEAILRRFAATAERRDPGFRVLRQGLGYTLSVVVAAAPEAGFGLMRRLAAVPDRDVAWILRSNLGKGRLARAHPREVEEVSLLLGV